MGIEAAIIGGAVAGGGLGLLGSKQQADAAKDGTNAAIAAERYNTDMAVQLSAPMRQVNNYALNALGSAFLPGWQGLDMSGMPGSGGQAFVGDIVKPPSGAYDHGAWDRYYTDRFISQGGLQDIIDQFGGGRVRTPQLQQAVDSWHRQNFGQDGKGYFGKHTDGIVNLLNANQGNWSGLLADRSNPQGGRMAPLGPNALSQIWDQLPGNQFLLNKTTENLQNAMGRSGSAVGGNALSALANNTQNVIQSQTVDRLMQLAGLSAGGAGMAQQAVMSNQSPALLYQGGVNQANGIGAGYQSVNNAINSGMQNYLMYQRLGQRNNGGID